MMIGSTAGWPRDLLTLADWQRLEPDEGHRVECVEGVLVVAPRPHYWHQKIAHRLVAELDRQLARDLTAVPDAEVLLTDVPLSVRAPDVVVVPMSVYRSRPARAAAADVRLVVEVVSPGSGRTDRVMKLSEYATVGIAEYWILDGDPLTLTAYALNPGGYQLRGEFRGIAELEACGGQVRLDLDALPEPQR